MDRGCAVETTENNNANRGGRTGAAGRRPLSGRLDAIRHCQRNDPLRARDMIAFSDNIRIIQRGGRVWVCII